MRLFLSYRRDDSSGHTGRIYDGLEAVFGKERVFKDLENIAHGENFVVAVRQALMEAEATLIIIGPRWTEPGASGRPRLFDEGDTVHLEVYEALTSRKLVIPVLVGGARFPKKGDIPEDLHSLLTLNALELSDSRWYTDMERLVAAIAGEPTGPAVQRLLKGKKAPLDPLPFVAWLILAGLLLVRLDDVSNGIAVFAAALLSIAGLWRIRRRRSRGALFAWVSLAVAALFAAALAAAYVGG